MIDPALVGVVSALTALIASIAGPMVTIYATRTQIRATVRSANRQRWIDEFRDTMAHFCSELAIAVQGRQKLVRDGQIVIQTESEFLHSFGRLIYTANKIRLMINPLESEHQELIQIIEGLFVRFRTAPADQDLQAEGLEIVKQIVTMSLTIIRREWLLVQRGA
jgi:formyltetrahydrofolate hydrolase